MKTWYYNLNARERLIVIGGAVALAVMIAYAAVWVPLSTKVELLRTSVDGQVNTLEWMHQASQEVRALKASGPATQRTTANRSLLAVVDQSAASAGLKSALQRMDPDGSNALKLQLGEVAFDRLILWLGELEAKHGIVITSLSLTEAQSPGQVEARLTLERPAS